MVDVEKGVRRVTFALPFGIDHVHCYLLRASSGAWILVDTGLGTRDPEARWRPVLDALDAPIERIVVTHMHPDHVGGARDAAEVTGAPVFQGREDYAQCVRAWGRRDPERFAAYWAAQGMPAEPRRGARAGVRPAARRRALDARPGAARSGRRGRRLAGRAAAAAMRTATSCSCATA